MFGAGDFDRGGLSPISYLGRPVRDEYNRQLGVVAGVTSYLPEPERTSGSAAKFNLVVQTSYGFEEIDPARVIVNSSTLVVRSEVKQELNEAKDKIVWFFSR
ncbi:MAG: hypothetical protein QXI37_02985, partial [Thermoprotei archaeon]